MITDATPARTARQPQPIARLPLRWLPLAAGVILLIVVLIGVRFQEPRILATHWAPVASLAVAPDASLVASGAGDFSIGLWALPDGAPRATLRGHQDWIFGLALMSAARCAAGMWAAAGCAPVLRAGPAASAHRSER